MQKEQVWENEKKERIHRWKIGKLFFIEQFKVLFRQQQKKNISHYYNNFWRLVHVTYVCSNIGRPFSFCEVCDCWKKSLKICYVSVMELRFSIKTSTDCDNILLLTQKKKKNHFTNDILVRILFFIQQFSTQNVSLVSCVLYVGRFDWLPSGRQRIQVWIIYAWFKINVQVFDCINQNLHFHSAESFQSFIIAASLLSTWVNLQVLVHVKLLLHQIFCIFHWKI